MDSEQRIFTCRGDQSITCTNMPRDSNLNKAIEVFESKFGGKPEIAAYGPGRVNLIGEHTDYNDGFVLPFALPYKTYLVGSRNSSGYGEVFTLHSSESAKFKVDKDLAPGEPSWANYVKGTVFQYINDLPASFGFNGVIVSAVPIGSGLSSSAALEVATATFLEAVCANEFKIDGVQKALRCQKAEHTFANMPCGIMDQYISALGVQNNLLLIDCRSKGFELVPFGSSASSAAAAVAAAAEKPVIIVTNSNVKHQLTGSEYPDRVRQCKEAVAALQKKFPAVKALRDATLDMLALIERDVSKTVFNRAKHVVSEDQRTLIAVRALKDGNYDAVGKCMTESHLSLRDQYEVSCEEIDLLIDLALQVPGVYGSRITGGGFGGCTVSLVEKGAVLTFQQFVRDSYYKQTQKVCDFYVTEPSEGAGYVRVADLPAEGERSSGSSSSSRGSWLDFVVPLSVVALVLSLGYQYLRSRE